MRKFVLTFVMALLISMQAVAGGYTDGYTVGDLVMEYKKPDNMQNRILFRWLQGLRWGILSMASAKIGEDFRNESVEKLLLLADCYNIDGYAVEDIIYEKYKSGEFIAGDSINLAMMIVIIKRGNRCVSKIVGKKYKLFDQYEY